MHHIAHCILGVHIKGMLEDQSPEATAKDIMEMRSTDYLRSSAHEILTWSSLERKARLRMCMEQFLAMISAEGMEQTGSTFQKYWHYVQSVAGFNVDPLALAKACAVGVADVVFRE